MAKHNEHFSFSIQPVESRTSIYVATTGLVITQVLIGIITHSVDEGGSYAFSISGSLAISDVIDLFISTILFWWECRQRRSHRSHIRYTELTLATQTEKSEGRLQYWKKVLQAFRSMPLPQYFREELPLVDRYSYCLLALLYALINNTSRIASSLAESGVVAFTATSATALSALIFVCFRGVSFSTNQWTLILVQSIGLVTITQCHFGTHHTDSLTVYTILLFQVLLTAIAGVYHQTLLQNHEGGSLHAANMMMYFAGAITNLLLYTVTRLLDANEPDFLTGYDDVEALCAILSNVCVGLAITAVYKHADVIIKCFATALSSGILLDIVPILHAADANPVIFIGALCIFGASWIYITTYKTPSASLSDGDRLPGLGVIFVRRLSAFAKKSELLVLITTFLSIVIMVVTLNTALRHEGVELVHMDATVVLDGY